MHLGLCSHDKIKVFVPILAVIAAKTACLQEIGQAQLRYTGIGLVRRF